MEVTPRKESGVRKKEEVAEMSQKHFSTFFTEDVLSGEVEVVHFPTFSTDYKELIEGRGGFFVVNPIPREKFTGLKNPKNK